MLRKVKLVGREIDISVAMHVLVWNVSMCARSTLCPTVLWIPVADKPLSLSAAPLDFLLPTV